MPLTQPASRHTVRLLFIAPLLLLGLNFLLNWNTTLDDAWITFRYARNLAAGHGLVFNPTDPQPTEGFTSILHVVFSCLGLLSGIHPLIFTRLANLILLGTVPLIALASLRSHWRQAPALSLLPLALYLGADATASHACNGMETIFFACGTFLLGLLAADVALQPSLPRSVLLGLAGFMLALVRPEAGLLFAVHLGLLAIRAGWVGFRRAAAPLISAGGTFALLLAAYLAWKWSYFGYLLPNSYYVKTRGAVFGLPSESWPGLRHVAQYLTSFDQGMPPALLLLLVILLLRPRAARSPVAAALGVHSLIPVAVLLAYYTRIVHESCWFRFEFAALLPVLYTASVFLAGPEGLLAGVTTGEGQAADDRAPQRVVVGLAVGFTLLAAHPWSLRYLPRALKEATILPSDTIFAWFGQDLARAGLGDRLVLMIGATGIIPYLSDATTVDYVGLNDNFLSGRIPSDVAATESYYRSRNPDVIFVKWPPGAARGKEEDPIFQVMLHSLQGKYPEGLMVRLHHSDAYLEFVHRVMNDLRERYQVVAVYGGGPYIVYLRRDSPHAEAVRKAFAASPYVLRGVDPAAYVAMKAAAGEMDPY